MMFDKLKAPFSPDRVSWRIGSTTQDKSRGMALGYIDARDVMERLDDVCGPDGWQNRYSHANGKTVCEIGLRINNEWIWKADGAGDTDFEAEKGALSDAFKRAAVRWGIGRYLYDVPATWVEIEQHGKSYKVKQPELVKLAKMLSGAPQQEAKPAAVKPNLLSEPAATTALDAVREDIKGCVTIAELDAFVRSEAYVKRVGVLPEKHRGFVRSAGKARLEELKRREAAQPGDYAA